MSKEFKQEEASMTGIIKIDGKAGVKIGNLQVFTYEGAIDAYRKFCQLFNASMTMEASSILSDASLDMNRLGFSWEEIEQIELSVL